MSHLHSVIVTTIDMTRMANEKNGFDSSLPHPDAHDVKIIDTDNKEFAITVDALSKLYDAVAKYDSVSAAIDILNGAAPKPSVNG